MDKLYRAVRDYAARRFVPLAFPLPPARRSQPDYVVLLNDLYLVLNDLNVGTRRAMAKHGFEPEQTDPPPAASGDHDALEQPALKKLSRESDQADLFLG